MVGDYYFSLFGRKENLAKINSCVYLKKIQDSYVIYIYIYIYSKILFFEKKGVKVQW